MKVISFFSEKGGVGKSSMSIFYASWLYHKHGIRTALADFNDRIASLRRDEMRARQNYIKENPGAALDPFNEAATWPIVSETVEDQRELRLSGIKYIHSQWLYDQTHGGALSDYDVVLCDFPGDVIGGKFIENFAARYLSLVVIPVEKDPMTINSTFRLNNTIKKQDHTTVCMFINKAELGMRNYRGEYLRLGKKLTKMGLPMLPDMISNSQKIGTIDKPNNFRSTFRYPDYELDSAGRPADLGLENLFIDITRLMDASPDLENTPKADLSFINGLSKTRDGHSFSGSAFPQFELPRENKAE